MCFDWTRVCVCCTQAWSVCPKLVLFFKALVVYAVLYAGGNGASDGVEDMEDNRSHRMTQSRGFFYPLFKCLPIVALMFFVALQSFRSSASVDAAANVAEGAEARTKLRPRTRAFAVKIFLGMSAVRTSSSII